jgi:hypothetical protein
MANFKLSKKNALSDTRSNIYELHEKKLEFLDNEKKNIDKYISELNEINNKLSNPLLLSYNEIFNLESKKSELVTKINNIENDRELNEYLLDFITIMNKYELLNKDVNNEKEKYNEVNMDNFVNSTLNTSKAKLYNEYIQKFNLNLQKIDIPAQSSLKCEKCRSDTTVYDPRSGCEICTNCGLSTNIIVYDDYVPVYTDTSEQVNIFNYKRNNHFQECLNQLQAKENTTIPPKIIEDLEIEFKKYNISDPKLFTPALVKSYLKKLKYNKYYEHIPTIINDFCGIKAPKMTPELEQQLKIMFDEIQSPFEKYTKIICPQRKNFLNYNYVFYKMCELLNKDEFLNCFPLLKSREKLYEHDLIWKGICTELRWEFIPSI